MIEHKCHQEPCGCGGRYVSIGGIPNPRSVADHAHQQTLFAQSAAAANNCLAMSQAMIQGVARQGIIAEQQLTQMIERANQPDPQRLALIRGLTQDSDTREVMRLLVQLLAREP